MSDIFKLFAEELQREGDTTGASPSPTQEHGDSDENRQKTADMQPGVDATTPSVSQYKGPGILSAFSTDTSSVGALERKSHPETGCGCGKTNVSKPGTSGVTPNITRGTRSGHHRKFAQVISGHLDAARRGDEHSFRWIELLLQGLAIGNVPVEGECGDAENILSIDTCQSAMGCTEHVAPCRVFFFSPGLEIPDLDPNLVCIPYVTGPGGNLDLDADDKIERVIVGIHGTPNSGLDAFGSYYNIGYALSGLPESELARTAVICPQFQRESKKPYTDCWPNVAYWSGNGYAYGNQNMNEGFGGTSSFDFLDALIQRAAFKYPKAKSYIVMGHSAGGQAVHRYALLDAGIGIWLWNFRGARVRYACYNSFFYTFPSPYRYIYHTKTPRYDCNGINPPDWGGAGWHWGIPEGVPGWNDYPYGLGSIKNNVGRSVKAINAMRWFGPPGVAGLENDTELLIRAYLHKDIYHFQATHDADYSCPDPPNLKVAQQGWTRPQRFSSFRDSFPQNWAYRFIGIDDLPHSLWCQCDYLTHCAARIYEKPESLDKIMGPLG